MRNTTVNGLRSNILILPLHGTFTKVYDLQKLPPGLQFHLVNRPNYFMESQKCNKA